MTETLTGEERRITIRLLSYWERQRGARLMPSEKDISAADIADLWANCFIARVKEGGGPDYRFSYLGSAIRDLYEEGMDPAETRNHNFPDINAVAAEYAKVIESGKPLVTEGEMTNPHGDVFKYRQVLLPLGTGTKVEGIFGGMRFLRVVSYG